MNCHTCPGRRRRAAAAPGEQAARARGRGRERAARPAQACARARAARAAAAGAGRAAGGGALALGTSGRGCAGAEPAARRSAGARGVRAPGTGRLGSRAASAGVQEQAREHRSGEQQAPGSGEARTGAGGRRRGRRVSSSLAGGLCRCGAHGTGGGTSRRGGEWHERAPSWQREQVWSMGTEAGVRVRRRRAGCGRPRASGDDRGGKGRRLQVQRSLRLWLGQVWQWRPCRSEAGTEAALELTRACEWSCGCGAREMQRTGGGREGRTRARSLACEMHEERRAGRKGGEAKAATGCDELGGAMHGELPSSMRRSGQERHSADSMCNARLAVVVDQS
jgi:hypothetical protein